jgi:hypothetical protein
MAVLLVGAKGHAKARLARLMIGGSDVREGPGTPATPL